jgi:hypothetical protein
VNIAYARKPTCRSQGLLTVISLLIYLGGCSAPGSDPSARLAATAAPTQRLASASATAAVAPEQPTPEATRRLPAQELTRDQAERYPATQPYTVAATFNPSGPSITIQWPGTGAATLRYQLYRRPVDGSAWEPLGEVKAQETAGAAMRPIYTADDRAITSGERYIYGVAGINGYGTQSVITASPEITVP